MNISSSASSVNEYDISGLEAMLAGTLCLMSAYSHCNCSNENNQGLIGLKIVSNLTCLQYQNNLSPEFRRVLSKVCESWRQHSMLTHADRPQDGNANAPSPALAPLWHSAPDRMQ
ncbi:MAG: hypothetical protein EAZ37_16345 [Burkholderiales bacterium]|nr:MAG: hypothetical protein EAZ37_16345 [Burkholderiales bacterium]